VGGLKRAEVCLHVGDLKEAAPIMYGGTKILLLDCMERCPGALPHTHNERIRSPRHERQIASAKYFSAPPSHQIKSGVHHQLLSPHSLVIHTEPSDPQGV
jgi:hypothetical protein